MYAPMMMILPLELMICPNFFFLTTTDDYRNLVGPNVHDFSMEMVLPEMLSEIS